MRRLGGPIAGTGCALALVVACVGGFAGRATAAPPPPSPIGGYWSVTATGGVHADGDAPELGDLHGMHLNAPIVGIAASPTGRGYWLAAADGGVFTFGDATFRGSAGAIHLNQPIVGVAATPSGNGYWLVASDGGVFTYGDARFHGSAGAIHLNQPIVGIAATPTGRGYRLAASDGGVFTYGDATFGGSAGALPLNAPIVGIASVGARGYRLAAADGGVFTYGGATYSGALTGTALVTGIATGPFGGYVLRDASHWTLPAFGNASNCLSHWGEPDPVQPFVGVAVAFNPSDPRVAPGGIATGACNDSPDTGTFRAPARWHIDVGDAPGSCTVNVIPRDPGPPAKRSLSFSYQALPTQIQMRSTQMNGHTLFEVAVNGPCQTVVVSSAFHPRSPPLEIFNRGDSDPFSSPNPITIQPDQGCLTEVRADDDGHLVQPRTGATIHLPAGAYWLANGTGCVVKVT
jgi:hypothetical protein